MGLAATLLAALTVALLARPTYRAIRVFRAHALGAEAEALLQQGQADAAMAKAQAAYQLAAEDPETLRVLARIYAARDQREALLYWQNLLFTGNATPADRRALAEFALDRRLVDTASEQVDWLMAHDAEASESLRVAAELALFQGDLARTEHLARQALDKSGTNATAQLVLARVLLRSPKAGAPGEARQWLRQVGQSDDRRGLEALSLLAREREVLRDDAAWVATRLLAHPLARAEHHLLAADLQLRLQPEQKASLLTEAIARYSKADDQSLLALGRWLNRLKEYERTLNAVPLESALNQRELFLVRLDAQSALGQWKEMRQVFDERLVPLDTPLKNLFRARVARELSQNEEANFFWRQVHLEETDDPTAWLYVALYAERVGDRPEATRAWRHLTQNPDFARTAYEALIRLSELDGDTQTLCGLMKDLCRLYPHDPEPRNDLAYLNLLLNQDLASARETGLNLLKEHPEFLAYRTTLALAHLRANDPAAAAALYEGLNADWPALLPGWQAVRVAVLGASGKTQLARVAAKLIPLQRLKPEERELVKAYL
ncbi:MAG: hypothetical protein FJ387_06065 [Verrucomicrobia bacterium]|nr:hypothetical protein [Verrucomicrobiota bacterium]